MNYHALCFYCIRETAGEVKEICTNFTSKLPIAKFELLEGSQFAIFELHISVFVF